MLLTPHVRKIILRMHTQCAQVSAGVRKPSMDSECASGMHLVNGTGNSPSPGQPTPDKSSRGSVDTTKTRLDPQRARLWCCVTPSSSVAQQLGLFRASTVWGTLPSPLVPRQEILQQLDAHDKQISALDTGINESAHLLEEAGVCSSLCSQW